MKHGATPPNNSAYCSRGLLPASTSQGKMMHTLFFYSLVRMSSSFTHITHVTGREPLNLPWMLLSLVTGRPKTSLYTQDPSEVTRSHNTLQAFLILSFLLRPLTGTIMSASSTVILSQWARTQIPLMQWSDLRIFKKKLGLRFSKLFYKL